MKAASRFQRRTLSGLVSSGALGCRDPQAPGPGGPEARRRDFFSSLEVYGPNATQFTPRWTVWSGASSVRTQACVVVLLVSKGESVNGPLG